MKWQRERRDNIRENVYVCARSRQYPTGESMRVRVNAAGRAVLFQTQLCMLVNKSFIVEKHGSSALFYLGHCITNMRIISVD